jgi:ferrous iron transport protein B
MQLLEMGVDVIVDLNMWDEFTRSGATLDIPRLESLLGTPVVTSVGHRGEGRRPLLDAVIKLVEDRSERHRHVPVSFGTHVERVLVELSRRIEEVAGPQLSIPARYLATKLLEGDPHIVEILHNRIPAARPLLGEVDRLREHIEKATRLEPARVISEGRHGFINGLLREVRVAKPFDRMQLSRNLDRLLTHRYLGFPVFLGFMWLLFNGTFVLGAYPMQGIEWLVARIGWLAGELLPPGLIADLIIDGVVGGVGSVLVFLPNIMLLFLGISILEDSGYMARSAFIMDRVMHLLGLHGKSFIPMLMGFGCTVPAIMATRTLENRRDRILTSLVLPHMSCSARLPVYILFAGAFFGAQAGNVVALIYLFGVLVAVLIGRLFSQTLFRHERASFVMELPPYRWPTLRGLLLHTWERSRLYLKKMGGVILVASVILWALSVFPRNPASQEYDAKIAALQAAEAPQGEVAQLVAEQAAAEVEYSMIGRVGNAIAPVIAPLGFSWQMGVTILTGFVAKEIVVSSMAVLYQVEGEDETVIEGLSAALRDPRHGVTPLSALAFMIFVLLYTPCIVAILMIRRELGTRWMWFDIGYQLILAWIVAFLVYQGGQLLGLG